MFDLGQAPGPLYLSALLSPAQPTTGISILVVPESGMLAGQWAFEPP